MKLLLPLIFLSQVLFAHNAAEHEHQELIPITEYNSELDASATSANKAIALLLGSLTEEQKKEVTFAFNAQERRDWSNLPAGMVPRAGVNVGSLSEEQRSLLYDFLSASLSEEGYNHVAEIMAAEGFLSHDERAARVQWNPENYWLSLYGEVAEGQIWGWQFGGHHLAINVTVGADSIKSVSPTFLGTEPSVFSYKGEEYSVLSSLHKSGSEIFESLSEEQKKQASFGDFPSDLSVGPGRYRYVPAKVGVAISELTEEQKTQILNLVSQWVGIQPEEDAKKRMAEIEKELDSSYFAYIGEFGLNKHCYFRVHGPSYIAELLSKVGNVGKDAAGKGHYHTVYRNLNLDYGGMKRGRR